MRVYINLCISFVPLHRALETMRFLTVRRCAGLVAFSAFTTLYGDSRKQKWRERLELAERVFFYVNRHSRPFSGAETFALVSARVSFSFFFFLFCFFPLCTQPRRAKYRGRFAYRANESARPSHRRRFLA